MRVLSLPVDALDVEAALLDLCHALAHDGRDLRAGLEEVLPQVHAERRHLPRQPLVAALQRQHLFPEETTRVTSLPRHRYHAVE